MYHSCINLEETIPFELKTVVIKLDGPPGPSKAYYAKAD